MKPTPRSDGSSRIGLVTALIGLLTALIVLFGAWYEMNNKRILDLEARLSRAQSAGEERPVSQVEAESTLIDLPLPGSAVDTQPESGAGRRTEQPETATEVPPAVVEAELVPKPPADPHIKMMHDYRFQLHRCEAGGSSVTCRLTVTSLRGNRQLTIGGFAYLSTRDEGIRSVAYTATGFDYFAVEASLGSRAQPNAVVSSLVEGQPMVATVAFDNVSSSTTAFSSLHVAFGSDRREFLVPFESIPIR
jgi:hypothetical protein